MTAVEWTSDREPWRVLVSGFLDWPADREAAARFDRFRCTQNPSGRLLIGRWHHGGTEPEAGGGELPRLLVASGRVPDGRPVEWRFAVLPVIWGIAQTLETENVDAVINIGLGVYDASDRILVERGASNLRCRQCDAAGRVPGEGDDLACLIDPGHGSVLGGCAVVDARVRTVSGPVDGTRYRVESAPARPDNAFVCNETHALMLRRASKCERPRQVAFIHIPAPSSDDDYPELARALAAVVVAIALP